MTEREELKLEREEWRMENKEWLQKQENLKRGNLTPMEDNLSNNILKVAIMKTQTNVESRKLATNMVGTEHTLAKRGSFYTTKLDNNPTKQAEPFNHSVIQSLGERVNLYDLTDADKETIVNNFILLTSGSKLLNEISIHKIPSLTSVHLGEALPTVGIGDTYALDEYITTSRLQPISYSVILPQSVVEILHTAFYAENSRDIFKYFSRYLEDKICNGDTGSSGGIYGLFTNTTSMATTTTATTTLALTDLLAMIRSTYSVFGNAIIINYRLLTTLLAEVNNTAVNCAKEYIENGTIEGMKIIPSQYCPYATSVNNIVAIGGDFTHYHLGLSLSGCDLGIVSKTTSYNKYLKASMGMGSVIQVPASFSCLKIHA